MPHTELTTPPSGDPPATPSPATPDPAALPAAMVVAKLATDLDTGLPSAVAAARLRMHRRDELDAAPTVPTWRRLAAQFTNPVGYLLLAAIGLALIAWAVDGLDGAEGSRGLDGVPFDAVVIGVVAVVKAVIGFVQQSRAERAVATLGDLTCTEATVVRDGERHRIPAAELVAGDLVLLTEGDVVPADARLVETEALRVAEAALTGESAPVAKSTDPVAPGSPIGDQTGMVFSGTGVVSGRAQAVVTATGPSTEIGKITALLADSDQPDTHTPLREVSQVGRVLGIAAVVIAVIVVAALIVVADLRTGRGLVDALLIGAAVAVVAVPHGLPTMLSGVLARGVQRMSDRNALVKRLTSVEALGSSTVICTDKTGTLTRNEMTLRRMVVPSASVEVTGTGYGPDGAVLLDGAELTGLTERAEVLDEVQWVLVGGVLASDASVTEIEGRHVPLGDPTEAAIVAAQVKAGLEPGQIDGRFVRKAEVPFTTERKRMSTIQADRDDEGHQIMAVKGAPEVLLHRCRAERGQAKVVPLDDDRRQWWLSHIDAMAAEALRILAVAYRPISARELASGVGPEDEMGLVLLGVVGIVDPPREEVREAIAVAQRAGVRVVMITGDHPATAAQIASELGIGERHQRVVTGPEVAALALSADGPDTLAALAAEVSIYARVAPEHKLHIVQALEASGEVVAVTGDAVNDAPTLTAADIGIAKGVSGTDVAADAADLVLTDDSFTTIVSAVGQGRAIFHKIRSLLRYLLSSNIGAVLTVLLGTVGAAVIGLTTGTGGSAGGGAGSGGLGGSGTLDGFAVPLLATQLLWVKLVTDSALALALGVDPAPPGLMDRRPRRLGDRLIDRRMLVGISVAGLTMALATLAMLDLRLPGGLLEVSLPGGPHDLPTARTAAFTTLVLAQLLNTFNARSDTETVWGSLLANPWLLAAITLSIGLQVAIVYVPLGNDAFGTAPLPALDWVAATALASSVLWVSELRKLFARHFTPAHQLD